MSIPPANHTVADPIGRCNTNEGDKGHQAFLGIDALRGLAALWVLGYHSRGFFFRTESLALSENLPHELTTRSFYDAFWSNGWLAVPLFFVVSGFCIHIPNVTQTSLNTRKYLVRRLVRIWIPFALASLLGLAMYVFADPDASSQLFLSFVLHLLFWIWSLDPWSGTDSALNAVMWSVVVEVQMYFLYALFWPIIKRIGLFKVFLSFLLFAICYRQIVDFYFANTQVPNILSPKCFALARFSEWLLGALIAEIIIKNQFSASRLLSYAGVFVGIALLVFSISVGTQGGFANAYIEQDMIASGCFGLLVFGVVSLEKVGGLPKDPVSNLLATACGILGHRCYSIYLFHYPALAIVGEFAFRFWFTNAISKDALGGTPPWLAVTTVGVMTALIVSEFIYRFVEKPSHQLARTLAKRVQFKGDLAPAE